MKQKKTSPLIRMLRYQWKHDKLIYLLCVICTITAALTPLVSVALPKIVIGYITGEAPTVWGMVMIAAAVFIVAAVIYFFNRFLNDISYPRMTALRIEYIRDQAVKLMSIDYKYLESATFLDEHETAFEATSSNNNGVEQIYHKMFEFPPIALTVIALSIFIGIRSPIILLMIILNIAATVWATLCVQKYEYRRRAILGKHERRVGYYSKASKDFSYGKDIRLYDLKSRILDNFKNEIRGYTDAVSMIKNREYALGFITLVTLFLSDAATYGILAYMAMNGMPIADFSMYIVAASTLSLQLTSMSDNITSITREYRYVRDYYDFIDADLGDEGGELTAAAPGTPLEIEFRNVTFTYPGTDKKVYDNFSLKIPAGQKLALVGINGAGKTTFVKLLTGLFRPDSGSILINGHDAGEYKRSELFAMFAVVFQDVNTLAFTVAQNIACALDGFDREKIAQVLGQVGLLDKVNSLPNGMDTMMLKIIDENGAVFSGGESQKLSIARALYKGGNCVIMDEPTSALDALAEAEIYSEFDMLTENKTSIYISHRLASTKFCDVIALIDGNGLREYGTHDELMAQHGAYYDMFVTQGKYYRKGGAV